jgi:hypothetical protein
LSAFHASVALRPPTQGVRFYVKVVPEDPLLGRMDASYAPLDTVNLADSWVIFCNKVIAARPILKIAEAVPSNLTVYYAGTTEPDDDLVSGKLRLKANEIIGKHVPSGQTDAFFLVTSMVGPTGERLGRAAWKRLSYPQCVEYLPSRVCPCTFLGGTRPLAPTFSRLLPLLLARFAVLAGAGGAASAGA